MNDSSLSTKLIHTGDGQDVKKLRGGASVPEVFPIYMTSVFAFDDVPSLDAVYEREREGYVYSRMANPNADAVCRVLAAAEGGGKALVFSSGMAAITTAILSFVGKGDHVVASEVLYGGVYDFFANELPRFGVETTFFDPMKGADGRLPDVAEHVRPNTKIVYVETIDNPLMRVPDIEACARAAHEVGALLFVDNTFATPVVARPLDLGADVVLYSATKYLGGHSDITGGAVVARDDLFDTLKHSQVLYGGTASPSDCWLLARSLRTLELRVRRHSENALAVAKFLDAQRAVAPAPKVERVHYPGLPSSPSHANAARQFTPGLFGGMLSVDVSGAAEAEALIRALRMVAFAPSLAGPATTVSYPVKTSHRFYSADALARAGITPGQLRFSIGLEAPDAIIEDIALALGTV
ncbi:MAG: PLP-dependent aspartate aminotransferase family protein [Synergistaceae bacterium]|nr:PLP-dependent aspartate aminotransferase family protein [Synergistaceae bacterium]